jgi:cytochrome P450
MATTFLPEASPQRAWLQLLRWVGNPTGYMEKAAQHNLDIFKARVTTGCDSMVFVSEPQAIQYLLTHDKKELYAPGDINEILRPLVGDNSLFLLEGNRHARQRKLLMPPFHGERMRAYGQQIIAITHRAMGKLKPKEGFIARTAMQDISLQVILETVFGLDAGERCQRVKGQIEEMLELFRSPLGSSFLFFPALQKDLGTWSPWGKFCRQREQLDELLYAEIAERRQHSDETRADILSLLMAARDEEGQPMTDEELRDELLTLLFAGHETTATALAWGLYWLHRHPEIREKLQQEIATLGDNPEPEQIASLPYLTAVCNETLRIYPVAMLTFPRMNKEPIELLGHEIAPDTIIVGCIYLTHHREDLYPDSYTFKPERFLERQFSPYEFLPFGNGARRCVGAALAMYEMKLALATIISQYSLTLAEPKPVRPSRRGVTLAPSGGVKMIYEGKKAQTSPATSANPVSV